MTKFLKSLLFVLVVVGLCSAYLKADSINIKAGSKVSHMAKGEWNEDNRLFGLEYQFNDNFIFEHSRFINSYGKPTQFTMVTGQYLPLQYKELNIGAGVSVGHQDGYCHKNFNTRQCKQGMDDTSLIALPYFIIEIDNFIIRYTYIPNSVEIMTFGFKAFEWGDNGK
jgi:hypothetical protein